MTDVFETPWLYRGHEGGTWKTFLHSVCTATRPMGYNVQIMHNQMEKDMENQIETGIIAQGARLT